MISRRWTLPRLLLLLPMVSAAATVGPSVTDGGSRVPWVSAAYPCSQCSRYGQAALAHGTLMSSPGQATDGGSLGAKLHWRPAPAVPVLTNRAHLLARPTLKEIVAGAQADTAAAEGASQGKTSRAVVEGELFPVKYRRTIRRYFELLRRRISEPGS